MTRHFTQDQLLEEAHRRFGPDPLEFAFLCPRCSDVASLREFKELGVGAKIGTECIGRVLGALTGSRKHDKYGLVHGDAPRGCDWCSYGPFPGPWEVTMPDGRTYHCFALAPATQPAASPLVPDYAYGPGMVA